MANAQQLPAAPPRKIFGSFSAFEDVLNQWRGYSWSGEPVKPLKEPIPTEDELLFASYGGGAYEGDAVVIFQKDGKLYEVHGSHCSCNGLEEQWEPEETSWAALAMRERETEESRGWHYLYDHDAEARIAYWALVDAAKAAEGCAA
jgi:hypothetical protein